MSITSDIPCIYRQNNPFVSSRDSQLISVEIFNRLAVIEAVTLPKEVESVQKEKGGVTDMTFATNNLGLGIFKQDLQENLLD
jgi:hypothetical protein